jgi:nucleotide-binding universal stress UspA family protein
VSSTTLKEAEEYMRESAMNYLDSLRKTFQEKGLTTLSVVRSGSPADQILEYAEANRIDLIAMSTHGRSGIGRWVLGSVTDKVLHAGDTAVLTVRASKV